MSQGEDKFTVNVGEVSFVVCITFIVPCRVIEANKSFSKFGGLPKQIRLAFLFGNLGLVNWSPGICYIFLHAIEDLLTPIVKKF